MPVLNPVVHDAPASSCKSIADINKTHKCMSTVAGEEDEGLDYSPATRAHLGMPGKHAGLMSKGSRLAGTCQLMTHMMTNHHNHVILWPLVTASLLCDHHDKALYLHMHN